MCWQVEKIKAALHADKDFIKEDLENVLVWNFLGINTILQIYEINYNVFLVSAGWHSRELSG